MFATNLKTIIVDDERPSREALVNYIHEFCPDVEIVAECESVETAYKAIIKQKPQLLFLDIEMPVGSGFDLLNMFKIIDFKVIFITAFSNYAVNAFRFSATDFLLKPVKVSELKEAVEKVKNEIGLKQSFLNTRVFVENLNLNNPAEKKLVIPNSQGFKILKPEDIIFCEANGYCTHLYLNKRTKITSSYNLKFFEENLPNDYFFRVHRSYIININHVTAYSNTGEIILTGDLKCALGESYKKAFFSLFKDTRFSFLFSNIKCRL